MKFVVFSILFPIYFSFVFFQNAEGSSPNGEVMIRDFDELKQAITEYNNGRLFESIKILSPANYKKHYQRIQGAPPSPEKTIPNFVKKGGWHALLNTAFIRDFDELKQAITEYNNGRLFESIKIFSPANYKKYHKRIPGAPPSPEKTIPNFVKKGGWHALLNTAFIRDFDELKRVIIRYNRGRVFEKDKIFSKSNYKKHYQRIQGAPPSPEKTIPDFTKKGGWPALLGTASSAVIRDFDELKRVIIRYNSERVFEKDRIFSKSNYKKHYKRIPGAPSSPENAIPDFTKKGGWHALFRKSPTVLI